jgi:hypothetical protein
MATQENFDRLYNMFRTRFRNQPRQVQEAMLEEARLARLAEAERRNIPREFANANIGTLAALRATAKDPFAQTRIPENVEGKIGEFLGVLPYNKRINNTRTRRVYPKRENVINGVLAVPARQERIARERAAALARKHAAAMKLYKETKDTEKERAKNQRAAAKKKSRVKRGHYSINRRVFNNTKAAKKRVAAYVNNVNNTRNKRKPGDKKRRNLTHRQRMIEKYIKQSINNNENN